MSFNPQFLDDYGIEYVLNNRGWLQINCPLCHDTDMKGGISSQGKSFYSCWRCGHHNLLFILSLLTNIPVADLPKILKEYGSSAIYYNEDKEFKAASKVELIGEPLKQVHKDYLANRNFDPDVLEMKYNLKGTTFKAEPDWKYRVIIPIYYKKTLVSYQGRDITDKSRLRYNGLSKEKSIIHYKNFFYGEDYVPARKVAVVEGLFDAWRMGDGFLCSYGSTLSPSQIVRLRELYDDISFLLDPTDNHAQEKAKEYVRELRGYGKNSQRLIIEDADGEDPGEFSPQDVKDIRIYIGFDR